VTLAKPAPTLSSIGLATPDTSDSAIKSGWTSLGDYLRRGYRPDIDGLRAIAVISVIAYHFHIGPVPGGFIGVDIFFVISGFLITGTIVSKLDVDAFSFLDFYQRRIRRIFPALAVMLLFVLVLGLTFLREDELFRVSASPFGLLYYGVAAGAAFITNFTLLHKADYFAQTAASQPLLHLWSLAIEEQFYVVWPLLLYGIRAIRAKYLPFVLAIAAASFAINILSVHTDPSAAFYSPLSRAWELMLGAALVCLPLERMGKVAGGADARSAAGLVLIATGLFAIKNSMAFPGWVALVPVLGTVLVISAGPEALANRTVLGAKALVWIGLISYPLYLWHWPALLFFQKYSSIFAAGPFERPSFKAAVLLCSVAASWLTFRFVEVPFRFGAWRDPLHTGGLTLAMTAIGLAGVIAPGIVLSAASLSPYQQQMMPLLRRVSELEDLDKLYGERPCFRYRRGDTAALFLQNQCVEPRYPGAKTVFLMGDSHSASLGLGLRPLLERSGTNLLQVSVGWCGEPITSNFEDTICSGIGELIRNKIAELKPDVVIVDAFWITALSPVGGSGDRLAHLSERLDDLRRQGARRIIVVGEIPVWYPSLPEALARDFVRNDKAIPQRTFVGVDPQSLEMDTAMRSAAYPSGVTYLSMKDVLCDNTGCLTRVGPDLERDIIVWDYGHLTPAGSAFIARRLIEPALADILAQE
jgi:peptidoglycan/LPS O-acetylase OafA/YrhL